MVRAARALLSAVTHLLVLADMSDVYKLLLQLKLVRYLEFYECYKQLVSLKLEFIWLNPVYIYQNKKWV